MSQPRKPALAKLLTPDPHAATTRRIAVAEVEEAIRQAKGGETRLVSGTRKIVGAEEIARHLAEREAPPEEQEQDDSIDVKLDSLSPPPAPIQRLSPLTPFVITPDGPTTVHDSNKATLSRAQVPTVALVVLASSVIFALLSALAYLTR